MIKLKKIKKQKFQASPLKMTCSCTILPLPFFNFSDFPSTGEVVKVYFPPLKRGGGPNYVPG